MTHPPISITPHELDNLEQLARRDDCLDELVPSDIRRLIAEIRRLHSRVSTTPDPSLIQFVESIVDATGPYTYLNGTPIVADAYAALRKHAENTTPDRAQRANWAKIAMMTNGYPCDDGSGRWVVSINRAADAIADVQGSEDSDHASSKQNALPCRVEEVRGHQGDERDQFAGVGKMVGWSGIPGNVCKETGKMDTSAERGHETEVSGTHQPDETPDEMELQHEAWKLLHKRYPGHVSPEMIRTMFGMMRPYLRLREREAAQPVGCVRDDGLFKNCAGTYWPATITAESYEEGGQRYVRLVNLLEQEKPDEELKWHQLALYRERQAIYAALCPVLGYPHDPENGWVTGDHTTETLAMEAASLLKREVSQPDEETRDPGLSAFVAYWKAWLLRAKNSHNAHMDHLQGQIFAVEAMLAQLEVTVVPGLEDIPCYSAYESDGMLNAFTAAQKHSGIRESLFAVASFILRARGHKRESSHLRKERDETVAMLRLVCEEHGDNNWPDDLYLADVVEKHLWRNLENARRGSGE